MVKKKPTKKQNKGAKRELKEAPLGVKIISILYYILAFLVFFLGTYLFLIGFLLLIKIMSISKWQEIVSALPFTATPLNIFLFGIFLLALSIFGIFLAKNIRLGRSWARTIIIIISALEVVSGIISLAPVTIIIGAIIGSYMLFSKKVEKFFK